MEIRSLDFAHILIALLGCEIKIIETYFTVVVNCILLNINMWIGTILPSKIIPKEGKTKTFYIIQSVENTSVELFDVNKIIQRTW